MKRPKATCDKIARSRLNYQTSDVNKAVHPRIAESKTSTGSQCIPPPQKNHIFHREPPKTSPPTSASGKNGKTRLHSRHQTLPHKTYNTRKIRLKLSVCGCWKWARHETSHRTAPDRRCARAPESPLVCEIESKSVVTWSEIESTHRDRWKTGIIFECCLFRTALDVSITIVTSSLTACYYLRCFMVYPLFSLTGVPDF